MKRCAKCKAEKPAEAFHVCRSSGGLQSRCIECLKTRKRWTIPEGHRARALAAFAQRFWAKVDKHGPDECWPWTGYSHKAGYGFISKAGHRAMLTAHRVSWELSNNRPVPNGLMVLHSCDNPPCVNPAHLRAGTAAENHQDMVSRGRANFSGLALGRKKSAA